MSDLFDLDALAAEADGRAPFRFQFGGEEYELPSDMDIRSAAALSSGRVYEGMRMLLGDEQWERMQASDTLLTDKMFGALFDAYVAHTGASGVGESSASTGSSKSTVRPSKRTSNGSTPRRSPTS